jgi:hypothetical protein
VCPRCPSRNPIFWEKSDFSNRAQGTHQEIRFFGKNRISQTVPKVPKKSNFWEKSDFSNRAQGAHQEIRFLGKIGFLLKKLKYPKGHWNFLVGFSRLNFSALIGTVAFRQTQSRAKRDHSRSERSEITVVCKSRQ